MKKLIALLLLLAMITAIFAGCTPNTPTETDPSQPPTDPTDDVLDWDSFECITVAEALAMKLADGQITEERYYIRGTVASLLNAAYGEMTLTDETGSIYVYGTYSEDGSLKYSEMTEKAFAGDEVLLHCTIKNHGGTIEINNARLIDFKHVEVEIDPSEYTKMTIAQAREAAIGDKVLVSGVVAQITYANGMIPSGVILVDETSSIYVYSRDVAAQVAIGNTITVAAAKTWWILGDEQNNAAKFGYKGCNQLENAILVNKDSSVSAFNTSWIEETTIKEIHDTPVTEDITSKIFKVTAIIRKAPGNGFTNYYINDLDDKTGSYAYSQCNGNDFAWLDAFDGKICTVYIMALNAKSTASDCFWRFLPVAVYDESFDVTTVNPAEYAVKYVGVGQFQANYTGDPALELITSVDSELLQFTGVTLSYTSSDPSVIRIDGNVMHCLKTGSAEITITGTYGDKTYSEKVTVSAEIQQQAVTYPTVADAIAAAVGQTVTVKGIVGPSLVNKTGFYLIDETGVVAIETTAEILATLKIGNEVVLEGVRQINTKGGTNYYGQTTIKDCKVVVNNYGTHDYSTASFDGEISVENFYNLDVTKDYTTSVFTMKATVLVVTGGYSKNIYITDGTTQIRLYCSNANQYSFLMAYDGQEVTIEIAPCNWNDKTYYVGCVLAVRNADGTKTLNTLNFNN